MKMDQLVGMAMAHRNAPFAMETLRSYESTVRKLAGFWGEEKTLEEITASDVHAWCDWLATEPIRVVTANFYRRTARSLFNHIGRTDLARAIRTRPEEPKESKAITDEDLACILARANVRDAAIILLLAESGCRRGTIPRLRQDRMKIWQAEDGEFRFVAETVEKGKNGGEPRFIFAGHKAAMAILLWLEVRPFDSDFVFNSVQTGEQINPNAITLMFRRLKMRAGIPKDHNVFAHAHRHRFAQKALDQHDAKIVSQWMGHKSVTTTLDIYGHRSVESLAEAFFGDKDVRLPDKEARKK